MSADFVMRRPRALAKHAMLGLIGLNSQPAPNERLEKKSLAL
jgi:hypothetical protein